MSNYITKDQAQKLVDSAVKRSEKNVDAKLNKLKRELQKNG